MKVVSIIYRFDNLDNESSLGFYIYLRQGRQLGLNHQQGC